MLPRMPRTEKNEAHSREAVGCANVTVTKKFREASYTRECSTGNTCSEALDTLTLSMLIAALKGRFCRSLPSADFGKNVCQSWGAKYERAPHQSLGPLSPPYNHAKHEGAHRF